MTNSWLTVPTSAAAAAAAYLRQKVCKEQSECKCKHKLVKDVCAREGCFPGMLYSIDGRLTEDAQTHTYKPLLTGTSPCSQEPALAHRNQPLLTGTSPCSQEQAPCKFRWLQRRMHRGDAYLRLHVIVMHSTVD